MFNGALSAGNQSQKIDQVSVLFSFFLSSATRLTALVALRRKELSLRVMKGNVREQAVGSIWDPSKRFPARTE
jgi:hypothetical protein